LLRPERSAPEEGVVGGRRKKMKKTERRKRREDGKNKTNPQLNAERRGPTERAMPATKRSKKHFPTKSSRVEKEGEKKVKRGL